MAPFVSRPTSTFTPSQGGPRSTSHPPVIFTIKVEFFAVPDILDWCCSSQNSDCDGGPHRNQLGYILLARDVLQHCQTTARYQIRTFTTSSSVSWVVSHFSLDICDTGEPKRTTTFIRSPRYSARGAVAASGPELSSVALYESKRCKWQRQANNRG